MESANSPVRPKPAENPAWTLYFRQKHVRPATQYLIFINFINKLITGKDWNEFCILAVRQ